MTDTHPLGFPRLSAWWAQPLPSAQARSLLDGAQRREQIYLRRGRGCLTCELQRLVCRFWLGEPTADHFEVLRARVQSPRRARAWVDLVEGQLLMSRRLEGALTLLERGFATAEPLLSPADYFAVLNRHRQLAILPLSPSPLPPEGLDGLLATAAVMERMGARRNTVLASNPNDLYG